MSMTLADALDLADHDSPLPHLAGEALRVLRAELERCHGSAKVETWRPMESSPRDNSPILLSARGAVYHARWSWIAEEFIAATVYDNTHIGVSEADGWQPLPPAIMKQQAATP